MSDVDRMYRLLCQRGPRGAHTHELRSMGYSGNPSQRAADIEAKYGVTVERERERRNGRNGSRFKLSGNVGMEAGGEASEGACASVGVTPDAPSLHSGVEPAGSPPALAPPERSVPSMFDHDADWAA